MTARRRALAVGPLWRRRRPTPPPKRRHPRGASAPSPLCCSACVFEDPHPSNQMRALCACAFESRPPVVSLCPHAPDPSTPVFCASRRTFSPVPKPIRCPLGPPRQAVTVTPSGPLAWRHTRNGGQVGAACAGRSPAGSLAHCLSRRDGICGVLVFRHARLLAGLLASNTAPPPTIQQHPAASAIGHAHMPFACLACPSPRSSPPC
ncbi:MAG: hypothetical protein J3K34DRAFT_412400, partial [Monoraphidium minutum]